MIQYKEGDYFGNVMFIREVERLINKNGTKKRAGLFECPFCKAQSKTDIINKTVIAEKDHDGRKVVPR